MFPITHIIFFILMFPAFAFCGSAEDDQFKKTYPNIPKTATSIKLLKQASEGDLIEFYDKGKKVIYINKKGSVIDVTKQITDLLPLKKNLLIEITSTNDFCHSVGCAYCKTDLQYEYFPFFWSQEICKILPNTTPASNTYVRPTSINNNELIVGQGYMFRDGVFYLGSKKNEKTFICRKLISVVWVNQEVVKQIDLFEDNRNYSNCLGRGLFPTIDDENFIHFWFDQHCLDYSGSIHLNELP